MLILYSFIPPFCVIIVLCLYMLQTLLWLLLCTTLCFLKKTRGNRSKYILIRSLILTCIFTVFGSLLPVDSSYHLVSFPYSDASLLPPTSFVLLFVKYVWFLFVNSINNTVILILFHIIFKSFNKGEEIWYTFIITYVIIFTRIIRIFIWIHITV